MKKLYLISIHKWLIFFSIFPLLFFAIWLSSNMIKYSPLNLLNFKVPVSKAYNGGKLAIIIDDFGESRLGVQKMMSINKHLTFAVMPFLSCSKQDAQTAHNKGYEVILHLPMESNTGKRSWMGPRPILANMECNIVKQIVRDSFESVPYAVGANIHMGSKASGKENIISNVLEVIKEKDLYFVDSQTARNPVSKKIATVMGVLCYERDIFIDDMKSKKTMKKQLQKAIAIALKNKKAIAIGHVGPAGGDKTAEVISEMIPEFEQDNISLVFVSELQ